MRTEIVFGLWWLGCGLITCGSLAVIIGPPRSEWPLWVTLVLGLIAGLTGAALGIAWGVA